MRAFAAFLSDSALLRDRSTFVAPEREDLAALLAHMAEVDFRRLYLRVGYPSLYAYCVDGLGFTEASARKRIQAARAIREFPLLFIAVAEGRLHLSAVCLLAPHLSPGNVEELVEEATYWTSAQIARWLAARFPRPRKPAGDRMVLPLPQTPHAPARVEHAPAHAAPGESWRLGTEDRRSD